MFRLVGSGDEVEAGEFGAGCGVCEVLVLSFCSLLMKYGASPGTLRHEQYRQQRALLMYRDRRVHCTSFGIRRMRREK
jgi:hypothetical protein